MKNKKVLKSIIMITLVVVMLFNPLSTFALSEMEINQETTADISKDAAQVIATYFLRETVGEDSTLTWNDNTISANAYTPLYNNDMDLVAHCFDFEEDGVACGYIVISASANTDFILEFADTGTSRYYEKSLEGYDVIYVSPAEFYFVEKQEGLAALFSAPMAVNINDEELRVSNIDDTVINQSETVNDNVAFLELINEQLSIDVAPAAYTYDRIENTVQYLQTYYSANAPYSSYYYKTLESRIGHFVMSYPGTEEVKNTGHCAITAVANILWSWRSQGYTSFPAGYQYLFNVTALVANTNDWFYAYYTVNDTVNNLPSWAHTGTYDEDVYKIANATCARYGYNNANSQYIDNVTWDTMKAEIDANRPFVLHLHASKNTTYGNHSVTVYAYNAFLNASGTGIVRFLKIHNGWDDHGVYIDNNAFASSTYGGQAAANMTRIIPG